MLFRSVTTLVIDEFDKCLEFGFHDEMAEVIGQLPALQKRVLCHRYAMPPLPKERLVVFLLRRLKP